MPSNAFADLPMTEKIHRSLGGTPDAPFRCMLSHVDDLAALAHGTWAPSSDAEHDALDAYERDFLSRFAYHTTVIEGSTLTPLETELVIEGEFVPSDDKGTRPSPSSTTTGSATTRRSRPGRQTGSLGRSWPSAAQASPPSARVASRACARRARTGPARKAD